MFALPFVLVVVVLFVIVVADVDVAQLAMQTRARWSVW